ncbi:unnamed protein product [Cyprideis torosa]|uniref:Transporter n=1 Tax=Cyprideis torosa TaxID=163714 RepID=A0A7R8WG17_9CRUS|nr:unnamed protein product [Cyprideis torosa]CAG0891251.1 unnamed protein product [Cyprideis torosa]
MSATNTVSDSTQIHPLGGRPIEKVLPLHASPEQQQRTWGEKGQFLLSCVSYAVGLGNIWRFPYLCFKHGGGVFLIPYLIAILTCALPVFLMEIALGQYFSLTTVKVIEGVAPILKGIGFTSLIMTAYINCYFNVVSAWGIAYLVRSFTNLPWSECTGAHWETPNCTDSRNHTVVGGNPIVEEYWENEILELSPGLEHPDGIRWELLGYLFVAWTITYLIIWKGLNNSGKILYFTALFPYVALSILFIRAVTLEGAGQGLKFYLKPNFSLLANGDTWMAAGSQVFYSYGLSLGVLFALGSYNDFHNNCRRDAIIIAFINSGTSLFGGLVTFAVLGNMAYNRKVSVEHVVTSGPGLTFLTYPEVVSSIPGAPFWSILFFLMFLTLAIDSVFCQVEAIVVSLTDLWPAQLQPRRKRFTLFVCVFFFLCGIPQVTRGGVYLTTIIDTFGAAGIALTMTCLTETLAVGWIFGADRLSEAMREMTGTAPPKWWSLCIKYTAPAYLIYLVIFFCIKHVPLTYESMTYGLYEYPTWGNALCWIITATSLLCGPIYAIYYVVTSPLPLRETIQVGLTSKSELLISRGKPVDKASALPVIGNPTFTISTPKGVEHQL